MNISKQFCLEGLGCLESITVKRGKTIAHISVLVCQDDIMLECEISNELMRTIDMLGNYLKEKQVILVCFKVSYEQFGACHSGVCKEDPDTMLRFCTKLLKVGGWYRDGVFESNSIEQRT